MLGNLPKSFLFVILIPSASCCGVEQFPVGGAGEHSLAGLLRAATSCQFAVIAAEKGENAGAQDPLLELTSVFQPLEPTIILKRSELTVLAEELAKSLKSPIAQDELPFSGVLSYQVYIATDQSEVVIAHVICSPEGHVVLERGTRKGKVIVLSDDVDDRVLVKSPVYLKLIFDQMQSRAPGEVARIDAHSNSKSK